MKKDKWLKKKLLVDAGIIAGFIVFLCVLAFGVNMAHESLDSDKRKLEGEKGGIVSQNIALNEKMKRASSSVEIYQKIIKRNRSEDFTLNRENAGQAYKDLQQKYRLNLSGLNTFDPIREVTDESFKMTTAIVLASGGKLNFSGVTDELIFRFLRELRNDLNGFAVITSIRLNKTGEIDANTLKELGKGASPALVTADLQLLWVGLKPKPEEKPPGATDDKKGGKP